jgi:hypothetical protein
MISLSNLLNQKRRAFPILERIFSNSYASFLAQLDYWMERTSKIKNGRKYLYKTYEQWSEELNLSTSTIRRIVSFFKGIGVIEVERLSKQTWYQSNWYSLSYNKLEAIVDEWSEGIQSLEQIVVFKAIASICSKWSLLSIDTTSKNTLHSLEAEKEKNDLTEEFSPQNLGIEEKQAFIPDKGIDPNQDKVSAAPRSTRPKKRTNEDVDRDKYVWEIAVDRPYPVFLNWWADTKYKPQGGRWEADAIGCAYSEFYGNPKRTEVAIYPQFLEYLNLVSENCNQLQTNDMQAALPSCFIAKPEPTQENTEILMGNVATLVERGATVALPQKVATPSCTQVMQFDEAQKTAAISPLAQLKAVAPQQLQRQRKTLRNSAVDVQELNEWLLSGQPALRKEAEKIAFSRGYKIERDENDEPLKIFDPLALSVAVGTLLSSEPEEADWDAIAQDTANFEATMMAEDPWKDSSHE